MNQLESGQRLVLPLNCYDEEGYIRPPKMLWWCLAFLARSFLVLIGALSARQDSGQLLSLFYPHHWVLYIGLGIGMGPVLLTLMIGFRSTLWHRGWHQVFVLLKPMLWLTVTADVLLQALIATQQHWQYSVWLAVGLSFEFVMIVWLLRSRHLAYMLADWRRPHDSP